MARESRVMLIMGTLALVGCGAADSGEAPGESVEVVEQPLGSGYTYHCHSPRGGGAELATLRLSAARAKLTAKGAGLTGAAATYQFNPDYRPRKTSHAHKAEYVWTDPGGHRMVLLVDESMQKGGAALGGGDRGGFVTVEGPRIAHAIETLLCLQ